MAVNAYITISNSDASLVKKFKVLQDSYAPVKEKSQTVRKTLDGKYDISSGGIFERHEYILRARGQDEDDDYGTKDDIDTFFSYNNPNGTPSNKLTLTDHYGAVHLVMMAGDFIPRPLGVMMEGLNSVFVVKAVFLFLESNIS